MNIPTNDIHRELLLLADPEIAQHSRRFFKTGNGEYGEGDRFLGIRVPVLRKLMKRYRGISADEAAASLASPYHEERLLSLLILVDRYRRGKQTTQRKIYDLYLANTASINNWDLVDSSAPHIVGAWLEARKRAPLYDLARSSSLWERRIAIIATFHFIRLHDFSDTLAIAGILVGDREDLIHKAVGWMLREVGKRAMEEEERFLKRYCRVMPRTMLRYAIEKFPEEKRKRYLAGDMS